MPALEGSITEFGLADILQLIYFQRKSGVLTVKGKYDTIKVTFLEGNILEVTSTRKPEDKRIGQIMLKKGKITAQQLQEVLQKQKTTGKKTGEILVEEGLVSREDIQQILMQQVIDQLVVMFSWKEGYYVFKPQRVVPREDALKVPVDTQHVLMEGLRILDEWSVVEGIITPGTVFRKKPGVEPVLEDLEFRLWEQIDGQSDVATIVEALGEEDLAVSKALLRMLEKGYIEPVEEEAEAPEEEEGTRKAGPALEWVAGIALAVLLLLVMAFGMVKMTSETSDTLKVLQTRALIDRASHMVALYFRQKGYYPEALSTNWTDPWGNPLVYKLTDRGYEVFSAGPDGKVSTEDDIY